MSRNYAVRICGGDERVFPDTSDCPNNDLHEPMPLGYNDFFEYCQQLNKTKKQIKCGGCGLLKIWVPREKRKPKVATNEVQ